MGDQLDFIDQDPSSKDNLATTNSDSYQQKPWSSNDNKVLEIYDDKDKNLYTHSQQIWNSGSPDALISTFHQRKVTLEEEFKRIQNSSDQNSSRRLRKRKVFEEEEDKAQMTPFSSEGAYIELGVRSSILVSSSFKNPITGTTSPLGTKDNLTPSKSSKPQIIVPNFKRIRLVAITPDGSEEEEYRIENSSSSHSTPETSPIKSLERMILNEDHYFFSKIKNLNNPSPNREKRSNSIYLSQIDDSIVFDYDKIFEPHRIYRPLPVTKQINLELENLRRIEASNFWQSYKDNLLELYHLEKCESLIGFDPNSYKVDHPFHEIRTVFKFFNHQNYTTIEPYLRHYARTYPCTSMERNPFIYRIPYEDRISSILQSFRLLEEEYLVEEDFSNSFQRTAEFMRKMYHVSLFSTLSGLTFSDLKPQLHPLPKDHQLYMIDEAIQVQRFLVDSRKYKVSMAKKLSKSIEKFWDNKLHAKERMKKAEEKRIKKLAKLVSNEVRRKWKLVEEIVRARYDLYNNQLQKEVGEKNLEAILEHSTKVLGMTSKESDTISFLNEYDMSLPEMSVNEEDLSHIEDDESIDQELFQGQEQSIDVIEKDGNCEDYEKSNELLHWMDSIGNPVFDIDQAEELQMENEIEQNLEIAIDDQANRMDLSSEKNSSVDSFLKDEIVPVPFLLKHTLRPYQYDGMKWLLELNKGHRNGILADEMGLGKTIQTIALLAYLACEGITWGPHLIIVPTSVLLNWEYELKKWCPGFKVLTYYGNQKERQIKRQGWSKPNAFNVCITTYQIALQDSKVFKRKYWNYLILDEAHNIKNFRSQRWQTLLTFSSEHRLLITGTPLQNSLMELWSLLYFLMPSGPTMKEFQDWFSSTVNQAVEHKTSSTDKRAQETVRKLHTVLRPYILRRTKAQVERQMPAKVEHVVYCRLSTRQRLLYDDFMSRAKTKEAFASGNYLSILNCLMQLRKVCNHPDLFETRSIVTGFSMQPSIIHEPLRILKYIQMKNQTQQLLEYNNNFNVTKLEFLYNVNYEINDSWPQDKTTREYANIEHYEMDRFRLTKVKDFLNSRKSRLCQVRWDKVRKINEYQKRFLPKSYSWIPHILLSLQDYNKQNFQNVLTHELFIAREMYLDELERQYTFLTPKVIVRDTSLNLASQTLPHTMIPKTFHKLMKRQEIFFPDKSLLQYDCGKLQKLDKLLKELFVGHHRCLLFTQMTKMLDIFESFLNIHGYRYLRLDGSTKVEDRQILMDRFNNDDRIFIFILSTRSGGVGMNLTGADTVIFYDSDWNPAMDAQAQDRAHRIGQTRDVHIYRLVSSYTIEENILKKSQQKRDLDNLVIQEGDFTTDFIHKTNWKDWMDMELTKVVDDGDIDHVLAGAEDEADRVALKNAKKELREQWVDFEEEKEQRSTELKKEDQDGLGTKEEDFSFNENSSKEEMNGQHDNLNNGHIEDYMFSAVLEAMNMRDLFSLSDFQL